MQSKQRIVLKNIYKTYNGKKVLKIQKEEFPLNGIIAIVGWSGSGKTTFLNIISLIDHPDVGIDGKIPTIEYYFNDETYVVRYFGKSKHPKVEKKDILGDIEIIDENILRRQIFGFIFQEHYLHPNFTVCENIQIPSFTNRNEIKKDELNKFCEKFGILEVLRSFPNKISGGQAQRASILRGLSKNAPVLFGDELTNNLDQRNSELILDQIKDAVDDKSSSLQCFLWVSHDIHLIKRYAHIIITIQKGKIKFRKNDFESYDSILEYISREDVSCFKKNNKEIKYLNIDLKKINLFRKIKYYFNYAYNDLFKNRYSPTLDFVVVVISLVFTVLFMSTIFKVNFASNKFLELKLSDPRINYIEIRANQKIGELSDYYFELLNKRLYKEVSFVSPVYYVTTSIKDNKDGVFRSNSNAITFRNGDPIVNQIAREKSKPFVVDNSDWKGIIINETRAKKFGYNNETQTMDIMFNNFGDRKANTKVPVLILNETFPFNKTMLIREEFYINNYKNSFNEEKPPIAFCLVYPKNIYDTIKIKKIIDSMGFFEIIDIFKVKNKIEILEEIRSQARLFTILSIGSIVFVSIMFISITIFRSIEKKKREIGVLLSYGITKSSFYLFYLWESVIIAMFTLAISTSSYSILVEPIINDLITKSNLFKIVELTNANSNVELELLKIPCIWLSAIYISTFLLLVIISTFMIWRFVSNKPINLIRNN